MHFRVVYAHKCILQAQRGSFMRLIIDVFLSLQLQENNPHQ